MTWIVVALAVWLLLAVTVVVVWNLAKVLVRRRSARAAAAERRPA